MLRAIVPHIIPELKLLFTRFIPMALVLMWIFASTDAFYLIRSEFKLLLYGFLLSLAGIYLVRITAFVIKRIITQIPYVIPDIYFDDSKNENQ